MSETPDVILRTNWILSVPRAVSASLIVVGPATADDLRRVKTQIDFLIESFDASDPDRPGSGATTKGTE